MNYNRTISSGGLLKRLKDASISDCHPLPSNYVDCSSRGELTFSFNPICASASSDNHELPRSMHEAWGKIVQKFEEKYTQIYIQSDMKKKAHLDCIEEGSNLIHEPKAKWCHVLLLDALVHSAHDYTFSALVESSVRRRKFNQHLELRNSILEVYGKTPHSLTPSSGSIVSPDMSERDMLGSNHQHFFKDEQHHGRHKTGVNLISPELLDRDLASFYPCASSISSSTGSSPPSKKNRKRKLAPTVSYDDADTENELLLENILSLLSDSPSSISLTMRADGLMNMGLQRAAESASIEVVMDSGLAATVARSNPWESHEIFQDYLLSLAGTDKSSKRFQTVVYDLCGKLSAEKADLNGRRNYLRGGHRSRPPSPPRQSQSELMTIIAAVISKVCATPECVSPVEDIGQDSDRSVQSMTSAPVHNHAALPDFDFYNIESDFSSDDEVKVNFTANPTLTSGHPYGNPIMDQNLTARNVLHIKEEPDMSRDFIVSEPMSTSLDPSRPHYVIPTHHSDGHGHGMNTSDSYRSNCESCVEADSERTSKAFSSLFHAYDTGFCHAYAQNSTFPSFSEIWDDFSECPDPY